MRIRPTLAILAGAAVVAALGFAAGSPYAQRFAQSSEPLAREAIAVAGGAGVTASFVNEGGAVVRHPVLSGGDDLDEATRAEVARAVARVPGVGGVFWKDGTLIADAGETGFTPTHCQEDVEGLLRTRTIRFEEGSSALIPSSQMLIDEVARSLRPCLGSIIAITGHTDESGKESDNLGLSRERALAVRKALIQRGIPRGALRAEGVGSVEPIEGLAPTDPANRRIEFSVIRTKPLTPSPIDTPGAR